MARSLKGERYVVFGGSGSIGRGIVAALLEQGASVVSASLSYQTARERLADLRREYGAKLGIGVVDVTNDSSMYCFCASLRDAEHSPPVHGIIYAVGNCPPTSFDQAVGTQLTYLALDELRSELNMHVIGLLSVARMFKWLEADSAVVVIGSAVTRLKVPVMATCGALRRCQSRTKGASHMVSSGSDSEREKNPYPLFGARGS